jgi:hypothetical protein
MLTNYESLSQDSKVWIYPSSRKFYPTEIEGVEKKVKEFIDSWKQEENNIQATYQLHYNRIISIFTSSEHTISTSAINKLVEFIINLQQEYEVELLDKMNVCFKQGEHVQYKDLKSFKTLIKGKAVNKNTVVFDNMVTTKGEFEEHWEVPVTESWYKNLFK